MQLENARRTPPQTSNPHARFLPPNRPQPSLWHGTHSSCSAAVAGAGGALTQARPSLSPGRYEESLSTALEERERELAQLRAGGEALRRARDEMFAKLAALRVGRGAGTPPATGTAWPSARASNPLLVAAR